MGLSLVQVSMRAKDDVDLILNSPSEEAYKEEVLQPYQSGSYDLFALFPDRFSTINPSHLPT